MAKRKLEVVILGDNKLSPTFRGASKDAKRFGKDMTVLGGISSKTGASLRLLGVGIAGVGVAMTGGLVLGLKKSIDAFGESQAVAKQTTTVLKSTGEAANITAKQVSALATSISKKSGMDDEAVQSGENLLLTFTRIRNETGKGNAIFDRTTQAAADLSAAMTAAGKNMSMSDAALQLGKALNDPAKGMSRLQRIGVTFTDGQKKQATALQKSGDMLGAQKIILRELSKEFGGSAAAAGSTFRGSINKLKTSLGNLGEVVGGAVAPALESAVGWLTKLIDQTVNGQGPIAGAFSTIKGAVKDAGDALDGLKDSFKNLTAGGKSPIAAIGTMIGDGLKSVNWNGVGATIAAGLSTAFAATGKLPDVISQGIGLAITNVDTSALAAKMADVGIKMLATLADPAFWISHWKEILSIVTLVIPVGKLLKIPGFSTLFKFISKPVFKAIEAAGKGALKLFGKVGAGAMQGLWTGLSREFPRVTGFIGKIAGKAAGALKGLPGKLKGIAGRAGGAVASALASKAGDVGAAAGHLSGQALKTLGRLAGKFFGPAARWIGNLIKGIASREAAVAGKILGLGAKIVKPLHDLGKRFVELGVNLIQGLISGIKSKAADVANAAMDVAKGAVDGVKGFLGIKSPSKVFEGIGKNVIAGFVGGILSKKERVQAGLNHSLLFPLDAAIAALEKKKETLQATWDKIDAGAEKSSLMRDLRRARNAPIKFSGGGSGGSGGGGGGGAASAALGGMRSVVSALSKLAERMGLKVTSTTGGKHAAGSYHYKGKAIDVAGTPKQMAAFFDYMKKNFGKRLLELFYDPKGGLKRGKSIGAIGGHSDHVHVAADSVAALRGGGKRDGKGKTKSKLTPDEIRGLAYAAGFRGQALDTAVAIAMAESGGKVGARNKNANGSVDRGLFQINSVHGKQSTTNLGKNVAAAFAIFKKAGNSFKDWVTYNSGAFKKFLGNTGKGKGAMPSGVTSNAGERMGNIREATKALREFMRDERRAKKLAKIDIKIAGLQQLKAFKEAIGGIRDQVKDLAQQAAAVWRGAEEARINAAHDAAITAVGNSPEAIELRALQEQDAKEQDERTKKGLDDNLDQTKENVTEAQAAVTEAEKQAAQDGSAAYKEEWAKNVTEAKKALEAAKQAQKDAEDDIEDYKRGKREDELQAAIDAATTAADTTQQTNLDGLDQQEIDYATSLENQFNALTTNLEKRKTSYAEWAKAVNDILKTYGLGVDVDPETEAALLAGPGAAAVTGPGAAVVGNPAIGAGAGGLPGVPSIGGGQLYDGHTLAWWQNPHNAKQHGKWRWPGEKDYKHSRAFKARALGGPVYSGETYLVGERGPELLTMGSGGGGSITPNNRLGSGSRRGGDVNIYGPVTIGSQKAARVLAARWAYRATFG